MPYSSALSNKNILEKGRKQHLNLAKKSNFPGEQKNVSSLTAHSFEIFNITSDNIVFLTNRRRGVLNFRLP